MVVKNKLDYQSYLACVNAIADAYFDEDGNYVPHLGRVVLRSIFVDYFTDLRPDESKEGETLVEDLVNNAEIESAMRNALQYASCIGFTFGDAYTDARELIEYRKSSLIQGVNLVGSIVTECMKPENLAKIYEMSDRFRNIADYVADNVTELFPKKES